MTTVGRLQRGRSGGHTQPDPRPGARRRGFTLIELLVAVALLGLVLSLAYTAFFQVSRSAGDLQQRLTERQELRLLLRMVADDLASVQYLDEWTTGGRSSGLIADVERVQEEEFTTVDFHAAGPTRFFRQVDEARDPGLHEVGYRVAPSQDRQRLLLVRREDFYLDDDLRGGGSEDLEVVLAERVREFRVRMLDPATAGASEEREQWLDRWDSRERPANSSPLPVAIRLSLAVEGESGEVHRESLAINLPRSLDVQAPPEQGEEEEVP